MGSERKNDREQTVSGTWQALRLHHSVLSWSFCFSWNKVPMTKEGQIRSHSYNLICHEIIFKTDFQILLVRHWCYSSLRALPLSSFSYLCHTTGPEGISFCYPSLFFSPARPNPSYFLFSPRIKGFHYLLLQLYWARYIVFAVQIPVYLLITCLVLQLQPLVGNSVWVIFVLL